MFGLSLSTILFTFCIPIICSVLGYKLAKRRNRECVLWAILCFLFPFLIIILLCLGILPTADRSKLNK